MALVDRTIADDEIEHLADHNGDIKTVVNAFLGTTPASFKGASFFQTATQTPFSATAPLVSTQSQAAISEAYTKAAALVTAHTGNAAAHPATAITMTAVGGITGPKVQDGLGQVETRLAVVESAIPTLGENFGTIKVDDYPGANADAKLSAALTDAASRTYRPDILLPYSFTTPVSYATKGRDTFSGMSLVLAAPGGVRGIEAVSTPSASPTSTGQRPGEIGLTFDSDTDEVCWFDPSSTARARALSFKGIIIRDQSFASGSRPGFLGNTHDVVFWLMRMHDFASEGLWGVVGTPNHPWLGNASSFSGMWNINNAPTTSINVGGADNKFNFDICLIDSNADVFDPPAGTPHVKLSGLAKCSMYNFYITATENWVALQSTGGAQDGVVDIYGSIMEGHNNGDPNEQNILKIQGGTVNYIGGNINYCVPASGEGVCEVTGGQLSLMGVSYARAGDGGAVPNVAETVPLARATGSAELSAALVKRGRYVGGGDPSWSGRPRIQDSSTGLVFCDASCTLI